MEIFNYVLFFCLGSIFASFLNLCVYRIENNYSLFEILAGRSACENCKKKLLWFELVPIFSFLFLKGKCSSCKKQISFFNIFSEIFLGVIFLTFAFLKIPLLYFLFVLILYFWAVYDFHFQNIPKKITDVLLIMSFFYWIVHLFLDFSLLQIYPILFSLVMALVIFLISLKKTVFGLGDILVIVVLAFWLKANLFFPTLFFSFMIGAVFSIFLIIKSKSYLKKYIPFLPFLFLGFVFALISEFADLKVFEYLLGMC